MSLEGHQLDRYRIVRLLGSGGMGDVYLAEDERIGQQVAIKVIRVETSPYPDIQKATRLFRREAKAIAILDHPHILPLFDYGEQQIGEVNVIYLAMPYRPEGSLAKWMSHREHTGLLSPQEVAHIIVQAASALQHAHDHQIIHQDVKPSNFLIRSHKETLSSPDVLLADFGIARVTTVTSSTSQSIRGTPIYMAPEQWEGKPVSASDQYALAIMSYELLTGHPPFQGVPGTVMYQHLTTSPTPPSVLNPLLSTEVDSVLLQALAKEPEKRFASVTAFAQALQHALQLLDIPAGATNGADTPPIGSLQNVPDSVDITSTLAATNTNHATIYPSSDSMAEEGLVSSSLPHPSNAKATNPLPASEKVITAYRGLSKKKTTLLVGAVLLFLLGSGGLIYAAIANQTTTRTPATVVAQINVTRFASATTNAAYAIEATQTAQTSATAFAYNSTGTATAHNNTNATATAQVNMATAQVRPTATARAEPTPTPTPTPHSSSLKILGSANNLSGYCQSIGDRSASLDGNTAYSWHCVTSSGSHVGMSLTAACRWQYQDSQAEDRMVNYFDPYSWECFTNAQRLGTASNLSGYCQSIGDNSASLDGNTAYSWHCVTSSGSHVSISMTDACRWQYNNSGALDRLADYFDPYSWECWG